MTALPFTTFTVLLVLPLVALGACPSWSRGAMNAYDPMVFEDEAMYVFTELNKTAIGLKLCSGANAWQVPAVGWKLIPGSESTPLYGLNNNISISALTADGKLLWTQPRDDDPDNGGTIAFGYHPGTNQLLHVNYKKNITAFSGSTGKWLWTVPNDAAAKSCGSSSAGYPITMLTKGFLLGCGDNMLFKYDNDAKNLWWENYGTVFYSTDALVVTMASTYNRSIPQTVYGVDPISGSSFWHFNPRARVEQLYYMSDKEILVVENYYSPGNPAIVLSCAVYNRLTDSYSRPSLLLEWEPENPGFQSMYTSSSIVFDPETPDLVYFGIYMAYGSQTRSLISVISATTPRVVRYLMLPDNPDFTLDLTARGGVYIRWRVDSPQQWLQQPRFIAATDPLWKRV